VNKLKDTTKVYSVGNIPYGSLSLIYTASGGYPSTSDTNGLGFTATIIAYKNTPGGRIYADAIGLLPGYIVIANDTSNHNSRFNLFYSWNSIDTADGYDLAVVQNDAHPDSCTYIIDVGRDTTYLDNGSYFGATQQNVWRTTTYAVTNGSDTLSLHGSINISKALIAQSLEVNSINTNTVIAQNYNGSQNYVQDPNTSMICGGAGDTVLGYYSNTSGDGNKSTGGHDYIRGHSNLATGIAFDFLDGQWLNTNKVGVWMRGSNDVLQNLMCPFGGAIVDVNEQRWHWISNVMGLGSTYHTMGVSSFRTRDTVGISFDFKKLGDAADSLGYGTLQLNRFLTTNGHGFNDAVSLNWYDSRTYIGFNQNGNDDIQINCNATDLAKRPYGTVSINNGQFGVLHGNGFSSSDSMNVIYGSNHFYGRTKFDSTITIADSIHLGKPLTDANISSANSWNTAYANRITSLSLTNLSGSISSNILTLSLPHIIDYSDANNISFKTNGNRFISISSSPNIWQYGDIDGTYNAGVLNFDWDNNIVVLQNGQNGSFLSLNDGTNDVQLYNGGNGSYIDINDYGIGKIDIYASMYAHHLYLNNLGLQYTGFTSAGLVTSTSAGVLGTTATLADSYISSATNWNTAYTNRITNLSLTNLLGSISSNTLTLSLPQSVATTAFPTFAGINSTQITVTNSDANQAAWFNKTNTGTILTANYNAAEVFGINTSGDVYGTGHLEMLGYIGVNVVPSAELHIHNASPSIRIGSTIDWTTWSNQTLGSINFYSNYDVNNYTSIYEWGNTATTQTTPDLRFKVGNADRVVVTHDGYVGIGGIPFPTAILDVENTSSAYNTDGVVARFGVGPTTDPHQRFLEIGNLAATTYSYIQSNNDSLNYSALSINPYGGNVHIGQITAADFTVNGHGSFTNSDVWQLYIGDGSNNYAIGRSYNDGCLYFTSPAPGYLKYVFSDPVKTTKYYVSALNTAPSSSTDTGTTGEIRFCNGYIYVCIAANTWQRTALTTW
jgi:hypothetical protein